ncbi:MAG: phospholipid carrier-dependent glycosyltransferase [ANME-2 cluster archaeon]|nr:MAG: phospholipid carrier-dependent glycosyltransferase [ANME-2 cluster archaeon]
MQVEFAKIKSLTPQHLLMAGILILSLILQLFKLKWGLVTENMGFTGLNAFHIVESNLVYISYNMMQTGSLNPHFFVEPSLFYNSMYVIFSLLTAIFGTLSFTQYIEIARMMTILLTVGVVLLTYLTGKEISNTKVGLFSALFMAINSYYLWFSSIVKEDSMMVFFITMSMYLFIRYLKTDSKNYFIYSMAAAGLAASTKYPAGMMLFLLPALFFIYNRTTSLHDRFTIITKSIAAFIIAFILGTPYSILSFNEFFRGATGELTHYTTTHPGFDHFTWFVHVQTITGLWDAANIWGRNGYGLIVLILFIAGLIFISMKLKAGVEKSEKFAWYAIISLVLLVIMIFGFIIKVKMGNQLMILTPAAMVISGYGFTQLIDRIRNVNLKRVVGSLIIILIFTYAVSGVVSSLHDNRYYAGQWLNENVNSEANIATTLFVWVPDGFNNTSVLPPDLDYLETSDYDYIILSSWEYERYLDSPETYPFESSFYQTIIDENTEYRPVATFLRTENSRQRTLNFGLRALISTLKHEEYRGEVDIRIYERM